MSDYLVTYENANGAIANFDDVANGYVLTGPIIDPFIPPVHHVTRPIFGQPGGLRTHTRLDVREIVVPMAVFGDPGPILQSRLRAFASLLDPQLGDGLLRVRRDGDDRHLVCRYSDGFGGMLRPNDWGPIDWWEGAVTFMAFDPYWKDVNATAMEWVAPSATAFFTQPFLPMNRLTTGTAFGSLDVEITGDAGAWPIWHIVGPATDPVITNESTGEVLDFTAAGGVTLATGERITVDTRPGYKLVSIEQLTGGEWEFVSNVLGFLTDASVLFDLRVGVNTIDFTATGTAGATRLQLEYQQRYLSP